MSVHPAQWLDRTPFRLIFNPPQSVNPFMAEADRMSTFIDGVQLGVSRFINTPAIRGDYIPPITSQMSRIKSKILTNMVRQSMLGLIADVWTKLLVNEADKQERGIHLLWDEDVPLPNPLTSLIWLLVCESWPMPAASQPQDLTDLSQIFPSQSFALPMSSSKLFANHYPGHFTAGSGMQHEWPLDELLMKHMTRGDRERMTSPAMMSASTRLYRPQVGSTVHYWQHSKQHPWNLARSEQWGDNEGWPKSPSVFLDSNIANPERSTSWFHLEHLMDIRKETCDELISHFGLPTHPHSLYICPGGWIRQWSEVGMGVKGKEGVGWTTDSDSVKLHDGRVLASVPVVSPRIWFGWTHIGPKYAMEDGQPTKTESASEAWVKAYMRHRPQALSMLFDSPKVDIDELVYNHAVSRGRTLVRAKRIMSHELPSSTSMLDAFKSKWKGKQ